jgi:hypothetical protein
MSEVNDIQLSPGTQVVDMNGETIGRIRAVYPHYIAVDGIGDHSPSYRVPPHTIVSLDGQKLRLSVPISALDELTHPGDTVEELPRHGGPIPQD